MDKLEQFKNFAAQTPHLGNMVLNKQVTWQQLYETYDIYGENHEIFKPKTQEEIKNNNTQSTTESNPTAATGAPNQEGSKVNWNSVINTVSNIDLVKVSDGLSGLKKIVDIFSEFTNKGTPSNPTTSNRRPFRRYND